MIQKSVCFLDESVYLVVRWGHLSGATAGAMNQKYKKREREKPLKGFSWLEICACGGSGGGVTLLRRMRSIQTL
jgi:hypothetical protein